MYVLSEFSQGGTMIHANALIHPTARIDKGVAIGPDTVIERNVRIGSETKIGSRVLIGEGTRIGRACRILEFAKIGEVPKDFSRKRSKIRLVLGDANVVHECTTLDRGITGRTTIGHGNTFMPNSRVGHDCVIGNQIVLAIGATLAGSNIVGSHVIFGGLASVDESHRIGDHALVTAGTRVSRDIPPYMLASGTRARLFGLNTAGLKNHGFPEEKLMKLKRAYYIIFRAGLALKQALKRLAEEELAQILEVQHIIQFIQSAPKR
jgi:UDP-N-acetylglucosamine acyltransferase